jgi:hypothetical protein
MWILLSENGSLKRTSNENYNDGCIEVSDNTEVFLNPSGYFYRNGAFTKEISIPENPIIDYIMSSECPVDPSLIRHVYWNGEQHVADSYFTIYLIVLHFNPDGTRNNKYDKYTWTRADKGTMVDNIFNPGTQVDEYDLFRDMVNSVYMPQLVQYGIYSAEEVLNTRIYEN